MRHAWTVVVLASLVAPDADAKCAMMGLAPEVLTPKSAVIAPEGGIVVGAVSEQDASLDDKDAAEQPGWRLRVGSRVEQPVTLTLAPGLVVYKLPDAAKDVALINDRRAMVGNVSVGPKTAVLGAPKIKKIVHEARQGKRPFATVQIELSAPAPAGVIALVIADSKGKTRSWGQAQPGTTSVFGYERRRCQVLSNNTVESRPGDKISVYWIDAGGRKSAASTATVVTKTGDSEDD
jgi:hypothetical protein